MRLIAISGGIGSGKSTVSHALETMGFVVYDCDSHAKRLTDSSPEILSRIAAEISPTALNNDGTLNRKALADIVFNDSSSLRCLNSIVHSAVLNDIRQWIECHKSSQSLLFIETAILYQSGLDKLVDEVWNVEAPKNIRITRVMQRNNLKAEDVEARINAQDSFKPAKPHPRTFTILNDNTAALLPQIKSLL